MDDHGDHCAVLCPERRTAGLMESFLYAPGHMPYVKVKRVLRMLRERIIGKHYNVQLSNIGAEIVLREDAFDQKQSMILYEIIDSEYRNNYVLFFAPEVLELKIAELCMSGYSNLDVLLKDDMCFHITIPAIRDLILILISEYFGKTIERGHILGNTGIMSADPYNLSLTRTEITDGTYEMKAKEYYCFCMVVDHKNIPFL